MVTVNVRDFPRIAQEWLGAERHHSGCAIDVGIYHSEFGTILCTLEAVLAARPNQEDWHDCTAFVSRRTRDTPHGG